jgi:molybdopterin-guanine dinucleotide biosynthesis protein A
MEASPLKSAIKDSAIRIPHSAIKNSALKGFVQAGGRSSRMGSDKSWLLIEDRPMIERAIAAVGPIVQSLAIVINAANPQAANYEKLAASWNAEILHDLHDHLGPLGGIHTALVNCQTDESALILACDLPFVTTEFLSLLCKIHQDPQSAIRNPQSMNPQSAIRNQRFRNHYSLLLRASLRRVRNASFFLNIRSKRI